MKLLKKSLFIGSVSIALLGGFVWVNQQGAVKQEEPVAEDTTKEEIDKEKMAKYEKAAEEIKKNKPKTIVGEVFTNGYLKKHGDHYHFVYGEVPKDAIFEHKNGKTPYPLNSNEDHYTFDFKDVVEENELGYVVRHGDHYHFIYKSQLNQTAHSLSSPGLVQSNFGGTTGAFLSTPPSTSKEENQTPDTSSSEKQFPGIHYPTSDGFLFDGNHIIGKTSKYLLVAHNGSLKDVHVIPYEQLVNSQWEYLIPKENLEEARARYYGRKVEEAPETNEPNTTQEVTPSENTTQENKEEKELERKIEEKIARIMKEYGVRRDQIVVDKEKNSIIYPHGDHHHAEPIDESKPFSGGHSHHNYETSKPEDGVAKKRNNKVYTGAELEEAIALLKASTFNNQAFTLANGQKRVSFTFAPGIDEKLGTNMIVKLTTPDGHQLEKLSGRVFGDGVGNIANFELLKSYLPGETFKYSITSKDYPEVHYEGTFTVTASLAYEMASHTIFYPFYAGDTHLRLKPQYKVPGGTEALVRVFDEFHGTPYLENNYKVGEIQLPIPEAYKGVTSTPGNVIRVTFMANPYEENESYYVVEVPVLDPKQKTEEPGVLKQFQEHAQKDAENTKPTTATAGEKEQGEKEKQPEETPQSTSEEQKETTKEEKPSDSTSKPSTSQSQSETPSTPKPHENEGSEPSLDSGENDEPAVDPVQEKLAKFAAGYGVGLDSLVFNMDGTAELRLPDGRSIPINMADFTK